MKTLTQQNTTDNVFRINKTVLTIDTIDSTDEKQFWMNKTPQERLEALEFLRQLVYGYDAASARLQRILVITQ